MKSVQTWFAEYNESHLNPTNKIIHWLCVPAIFFAIVGILASLFWYVFLAVATLVLLFYWWLDKGLFVAMMAMMAIFTAIVVLLDLPLTVYVAIFVLAWIGQFYGHKIEGKKPSFFKDVQFLLIGPAWCMDAWLDKWLPSWQSRQPKPL